MCQNAAKTVGSVMEALGPSLNNILTIEGVAGTPQAQEALAAYNKAASDLANWTQGSVSQTVLEALGAVQDAVTALGPLVPAQAGALVSVVLAGIATVIGVVQANSPAPTATTAIPAEEAVPNEDIQAHYQAHVAAETAAKVHALVPGFKRSLFHTAASQYKSEWNKAVDEAGYPTSWHC